MSYLKPTASSQSQRYNRPPPQPPASPSTRRRIPPPLTTSLSPSPRSSRIRRALPSPSSTPRRSGADGSALDKVDDGPVVAFVTSLNSLSAESWTARTLALEKLLCHIPGNGSDSERDVIATLSRGGISVDGGTDNDDAARSYEQRVLSEGLVPFYLSPTTLRRLAGPIGSLLTDPRSTVVKHACYHLTLLVERTGSAPSLSESGAGNAQQQTQSQQQQQQQQQQQRPDRARHLLRDLLPTILSMHGQTVNIIRGYALSMTLSLIPLCRFKSALPTLLDALRKNKSREVREASAKYIHSALDSWANTTTTNSVGVSVPYLTTDVATHIGNALARALMDPSQAVRMEARLGFETFRLHYPDIWHRVVHREGGPLSTDFRLKKSIINAAVRADAERALREGVNVPDEGGSGAGNGQLLSAGAAEDDAASVGSSFSYQSGNSGISKASDVSYSSRMASRPPGNAWAGGAGAGGKVPSAVSSRPGVGKSMIPAPSPRVKDRNRIGASLAAGRGMGVGTSTKTGRNLSRSPPVPPPPRSPPKRAVMNGGSRATAANAFASIIASPAPGVGANRDHMLVREDQKHPQMHNRAATSIQAAFRGVNARKSILPPLDTENMSDFPTLGRTAQQMADRRKTIGAKGADAMTPLAAMQETPTAVGTTKQRFRWNDDMLSPVRSIAFEEIDKVRKVKNMRDRQSSVLLQKRLLQSSIGTTSLQRAVAASSPTNDSPFLPLSPCIEHVDIARQLLSVHRSHIDGLMGTLRHEMDLISDFEKILNDKGTEGPTEDDVLDYFESMQVCLDERSDMGEALRKQLDTISKGDEGEI